MSLQLSSCNQVNYLHYQETMTTLAQYFPAPVGRMVLSYVGDLQEAARFLTFLGKRIKDDEIVIDGEKIYSFTGASEIPAHVVFTDREKRLEKVEKLALSCSRGVFSNVMPFLKNLRALTIFYPEGFKNRHALQLQVSTPNLNRLELLTRMDTVLDITNMGLKALSHLPLTHVAIRGYAMISDIGLRHILKCPLEHLELSGTSLTDEGMQFVQTHEKLRSVNFSHNRRLTAQTLPTLVSSKSIIEITLNSLSCDPLEHHFDINLALACCALSPNIFVLSIQYSKIHNEGLKTLAVRFPNLVFLDVSHCHSITVDGLKHVKGLPLQEIETRDCLNISPADISGLQREMAKLSIT